MCAPQASACMKACAKALGTFSSSDLSIEHVSAVMGMPAAILESEPVKVGADFESHCGRPSAS